MNIRTLEDAMLRSIGIFCVLTALLGLDCAKPPPPPPEPAPDPSHFSGERAWGHLEKLVEIGPRASGTAGAEEARSYLRAQLEAIGVEPTSLSFDVTIDFAEGGVEKFDYESVLAVMPGESEDLVVLAAPFDSRHFESFTHVGANNGASGAALLLEMARVLSVDPIPYTVWLAFLDGEAPHGEERGYDWSLVGSRDLAEEIHESGGLSRIRLLVYFNQVADPDLVIARDLMSDRVVRKAFQRAAKELGHESVFPVDRPFSRPPGGHAVFHAVGVRRVMAVIDDRFGGDEAPGVYWQTEEDTLERCDPESLATVGTVSNAGIREVVTLLRKVDLFSRKPAPVPEPEPVEADDTPEPPGGTPQEGVAPSP
jgi:hypothetical protein